MTNPAPGTLAWFEVATSDPDGAEKFYGSLFDWTFEADGPAASGGMDYRNIKASGADEPMGGVFGTGGQMPDHAVFYILVADVEATCADAEQLGGSVVSKHVDPGPGAPTFAYLRDLAFEALLASAEPLKTVDVARAILERSALNVGAGD